MNAKMAKILRRVAEKSGWTKEQYQATKEIVESLNAQGREEGKLILKSLLRGEKLPEVVE
jgi:hypothetical protein